MEGRWLEMEDQDFTVTFFCPAEYFSVIMYMWHIFKIINNNEINSFLSSKLNTTNLISNLFIV
jgi:hypothetical protein